NARSWSPGSSRDDARHVGASTRWKFTTSPNSQTSEDPGTGRRGQISWPRSTAKPLWSAGLVTRTSTARTLAQHPRSSHWRATCGDKSHASFGLGAVGKGPAQQAPRRRPTSTLLQHLSTAVEKTCRHHRGCLRQPAVTDAESPLAAPATPFLERVRQRHQDVNQLAAHGTSALCRGGHRLCARAGSRLMPGVCARAGSDPGAVARGVPPGRGVEASRADVVGVEPVDGCGGGRLARLRFRPTSGRFGHVVT
ncbi:hypothetical protein SAMN02787118_13667, partial [Streptomyces mirabilis]